MNIKTLALAVIAASSLAAGAASALTLGDTLESGYFFPTDVSPYEVGPTFTVAPGVLGTQYADGNPIVESYSGRFDAAGGYETYTFTFDGTIFAGGTFNGIVLHDLTGNFGAIFSVTGVPYANVLSSGNKLAVSWQSQSFNAGDKVRVALVVLSGDVPEPATWALMLGGFGMVGLALRRRRVSGVAA